MDDMQYSCPVDAALSAIGGKWKMQILWRLVQRPHRYGELRRAIPEITEKMLYQQLRQLEAEKLVHREAYAEVPPRVEYSLTDRSEALIPILNRMADWAFEHLDDRIEPSAPTKASVPEAVPDPADS